MMFFVVLRQEYTINTTNALTYSTEFTTVHSGISIFIFIFYFFGPSELVYTIKKKQKKHAQIRLKCCHFVRELVVREEICQHTTGPHIMLPCT